MKLKPISVILALTPLALAACGGGGGGAASTISSGGSAVAATQAAVTSGTVTALGSVFVNNNEYDTTTAKVVDDDTGVLSNTTLAPILTPGVGSQANVAIGATGSNGLKAANEIRLVNLARGYADNIDTGLNTITVMGQTAQITPSMTFTDLRVNPTTHVTGLADIVSNTSTTSTPSAGAMFVMVSGYYFGGANNTNNTQTQFIATKVTVLDSSTLSLFNTSYPTDKGGSAMLYEFKGSSVATSAGSSSALSLGSENITIIPTTQCSINGAAATNAQCASIPAGAIVSFMGNTIPINTYSSGSFSSGNFIANQINAYTNGLGTIATTGQTVEVEGEVSYVSGSTFYLNGVTINGSALTSIPVAGTHVEITGTLNSDGSITAVNTQSEAASQIAPNLPRSIFASMVNPATSISAATPLANGSCGTSPTYMLSILGQTVEMDCHTEFADKTVSDDTAYNATTKLNINSLSSYLTNLGSSVYVMASGFKDPSGTIHAKNFSVMAYGATNPLGINTSQSIFSGLASSASVSGSVSTLSLNGVNVLFGNGTSFTLNDLNTGTTGGTALISNPTSLSVGVGDFVVAKGVASTVSGAVTLDTTQSGTLTDTTAALITANANLELNGTGGSDSAPGAYQGFAGFDH